ncbi:DMT family transporter [Sphingomonas sp.]|uniref:DMT family transporter n=1 Tax=Sphingomonas sp. TaxID=28214 RepID=UPI003CC69E50
MSTAPNSTRLAILLPFAIVTLIWGSTWIVIRGQLGVVPPQWSVAYRFALAAMALGSYAAWRGERFRLDARGYFFAAANGLAQFCLNFNFVYQAERWITSGLVAVTFALLLIPNALMARVFLGQRLGRQLLLGSAVAMTGVALLFVHELRADPRGSGASLTGIALALCAIMAASTANVLQATATAKRYPLYATVAWSMAIGAAVDAAFAWALTGPPVIEWRLGYIAGVAYLALAASALAFPLYYTVLRMIGPAKAAYSSIIVPVIAMTLSTLFEGYRWGVLAVGGAALAAVGLVIALTARRPAR